MMINYTILMHPMTAVTLGAVSSWWAETSQLCSVKPFVLIHFELCDCNSTTHSLKSKTGKLMFTIPKKTTEIYKIDIYVPFLHYSTEIFNSSS